MLWPTAHIRLSLLIRMLLVPSDHSKVYSWQQTVECYSCMSKGYELHWGTMELEYHRQRNFTEYCNDDYFQPHLIKTVKCSHICVILKEPNVVAGMTSGYNFIRGCYSNILKNGFNESAIDTHRFRLMDQCRSLERSKLMKGRGMQGNVVMCSCYENRCNGNLATSHSVGRLTQLHWLLALLVLTR